MGENGETAERLNAMLRAVKVDLWRLERELDVHIEGTVSRRELAALLDEIEATVEAYDVGSFTTDAYAPKVAIEQVREEFDLE